MHAAPSVSHPVGRSAFAGRAVALAVLAAAAVAAVFTFLSSPGWRPLVVWAAVAACGTAAGLAWWRSPRGELRWDGADWWWAEEGGSVSGGRPEIALDLQSRLLLRWAGEGGVRWLWLERASDASHWDALRRAVYSRASTPVPAAGKPPAAEQ